MDKNIWVMICCSFDFEKENGVYSSTNIHLTGAGWNVINIRQEVPKLKRKVRRQGWTRGKTLL